MKSQRLIAAETYQENGLQTVALKPGEKSPAFMRPYDRPIYSPEELGELFGNERYNIGIVCGAASRELIVADFDDRAAIRKERGRVDMFIKAGCPTVETFRGIHFYARVPGIAGVDFPKFTSIDLKRSGHVVAPNSVLNTGQLYLFAETFSDIPVIPLNEYPFPHRRKENHLIIQTPSGIVIPHNERPHGIPAHLFAVLKGSLNGKATRSEAEQSLILYCINNGWTFHQVKTLFDFHAEAGTKYREKGRHAAGYLSACYSNAAQYLLSHRSDIDKQIDAMSRWAENPRHFQSRTRGTDQAVFRAMLEIARRTGKVSDIYASRREIAELASCSGKTAGNALKRIPFLILARRDIDPFTPAVWNIDTKCVFSNLSLSTIPTHSPGLLGMGTDGKLTNVDLRHDAFRFQALGKTGAALLAAMSETEWRTVAQIVKSSGQNVRTAYRKIELLENVGLIERRGKGYGKEYRQIKGANLDRAAELLGTAGAGQRQRATHKAERAAVEQIKKAYAESLNATRH